MGVNCTFKSTAIYAMLKFEFGWVFCYGISLFCPVWWQSKAAPLFFSNFWIPGCWQVYHSTIRDAVTLAVDRSCNKKWEHLPIKIRQYSPNYVSWNSCFVLIFKTEIPKICHKVNFEQWSILLKQTPRFNFFFFSIENTCFGVPLFE